MDFFNGFVIAFLAMGWYNSYRKRKMLNSLENEYFKVFLDENNLEVDVKEGIGISGYINEQIKYSGNVVPFRKDQ